MSRVTSRARVETAVGPRMLVPSQPPLSKRVWAKLERFLRAAALWFEGLWSVNAPVGPAQPPVHECVTVDG